MGEAAKAFWVNEEDVEEVCVSEFEDISYICTGVQDEQWKFGTD